MFDLTGKKALVTGGSRGIGRGICLALAKQGADVAVNYRSNQAEAETVVSEIKAMGRQAFAVQADVSLAESVAKMFAEIKNRWGKLDILVNNAGIVKFANFEEVTEEDWDKTLDTNLKGQFLCARAVVPYMEKQGGGRIINIASVASGGVGFGGSMIAHYSASKGGVVALTEALGAELAKKGIRVNAIAPGLIETDMGKIVLNNPQMRETMLARIPVGRPGRPEDIAAVAAFLASDEADYITGAVLYIDGGWLAG